MRTHREPIFNLPAVVLAAVVVLFGIYAVQSYWPDLNVTLLREFSFVPGRFTVAFDPSAIAASLDAAQRRGAVYGEVARFFLGDGHPLWWTPITYAFLHASFLHVGFNCLWLVAFGTPVARRFGTWRFLLFCLFTAAAGALAHYLAHMADLEPVIGASAVVSGMMAAAVRFVFQPFVQVGERTEGPDLSGRIPVYWQPALPLRSLVTSRPAMAFLFAWFFANLLFGLAPQLAGFAGATIAWQAHIGGFVVGLLAFRWFDPPAPDFLPNNETA